MPKPLNETVLGNRNSHCLKALWDYVLIVNSREIYWLSSGKQILHHGNRTHGHNVPPVVTRRGHITCGFFLPKMLNLNQSGGNNQTNPNWKTFYKTTSESFFKECVINLVNCTILMTKVIQLLNLRPNLWLDSELTRDGPLRRARKRIFLGHLGKSEYGPYIR